MTTYYIAPGNQFNGDGTLPTPATSGGGAGAYNTWSGVTLTANNTYLQKRGTKYIGNLRPQAQTSASTTPLTIGAYYNNDGTDNNSYPRPIIDHNGGSNGVGCIFVDNCSYVVIQDFELQNSQAASGGGVKARATTGSQNNLLVKRCVCHDNMTGIHAAVTTGAYTYTDIDITDNICYNNRAGIIHQWGAVSGCQIKRVRIMRNKVYNNGKILSAQRPGGITYIFDGGNNKTSTYFALDIIVTDNVVLDNDNYAVQGYLTTNETWSSSYSRNHIYGNNKNGLVDTHSLWLGGCNKIIIEDNFIHDNTGYIGANVGTCCGVILDITSDLATGCDSCIVRRNVIVNGWFGTTLGPVPNEAIICIASNNNTIYSNFIMNFGNGLAATSNSNNNTFENNTVMNCNGTLPRGYGAIVTSGTGNSISKNVFYNCRTGVHVDTSYTITESYNSFYNCVQNTSRGTPAAETSGDALGTGSISSDPMITERGIPKAGSPLLGAVPTASSKWRSGADRRAFKMPNPIGAYEAMASRGVRGNSAYVTYGYVLDGYIS